jgi:hypothetical protein
VPKPRSGVRMQPTAQAVGEQSLGDNEPRRGERAIFRRPRWPALYASSPPPLQSKELQAFYPEGAP